MRGRRIRTRFAIAAIAALGFAATSSARQVQSQAGTRAELASLKTRAESSEFKETSRYDDVVSFMEAVAKASPKVRLTTFGKTFEGRTLPLAVVGAPDPTPAVVRKTGKQRVYIQGNIHAGEVEGKESAQMLLRDLAEGRHDDWLQSMVLLIAPIYNADGNERVSTNNRGRQYGPIAGQGQRPNAQNYDLNRDHMKLDSPEARAFVKLMNDYDPQLTMDLHTTDGSVHGYYLTYAPSLNPATDPAIIDFLRKQLLPSVTKAIKAKYDWDFYYYGNIEGRGDERAWRSFDHRPRFNNNYIGLRNRVAILSEAYAYATFEDRIKATSRFVEEVLTDANAGAIRKVTDAADKTSIIGSKLALRAELERAPEPVEILLGEVTEEKNPINGNIMNRRVDVRKPERMPEYGTFKATETERVPSAYYLPWALTDVVDRLHAHGIIMTPVASRNVQIEEFHIQTNELAPREFQGHRERTLTGTWGPAERQLPVGTLRVDMKQPLARLAFYLLEPRSDDGLLDWNFLDDVLSGEVKVYPIVRTRN
jgi:Zinc carboxypeptidase